MTVVLLCELSTRVKVEIVSLCKYCLFVIFSVVGVILWRRKGFHWSRAWCLMIMTWWNELRLSVCVTWLCVKGWALLADHVILKGLICKESMMLCRWGSEHETTLVPNMSIRIKLLQVQKITKFFRPLSMYICSFCFLDGDHAVIPYFILCTCVCTHKLFKTNGKFSWIGHVVFIGKSKCPS